MKRKIIIYLISTLMVVFVAGCGGGEKAKKEKDDTVPVRVMKVKLEDVDRSLEYVGNIQGQDEAIVYPKVTGKISEKVKEDGSAVLKGDIIAYIDRDEVGLQYEKAPVESPLSGTVGRVYVDLGSSVTMQTPIALVANMDKAEIDLDIPEKYLPKVNKGQNALVVVDAYPNRAFSGKVSKISPVVDLATRTAPVEISIDNPEHLLQSGMFAKVRLVIEETKGIPVILREAVIGKEPETYVYIVENKKAVLRKVQLGIRSGPYYEAKEGLKEGDAVVIMGQQRLQDGTLVEAEE